MHRPLGYIAASGAMLPEQCACRPAAARLHRPERPLQRSDKARPMAGALVMKAVGFLIGDPARSPRLTSCPYWHWSPMTLSTPFCVRIRPDALFVPRGSPGGVLVQEIPASVDLVLVYLHDEAEVYHRANVFAANYREISQLAVERLPCAEGFTGWAAYYEDGLLVLE